MDENTKLLTKENIILAHENIENSNKYNSDLTDTENIVNIYFDNIFYNISNSSWETNGKYKTIDWTNYNENEIKNELIQNDDNGGKSYKLENLLIIIPESKIHNGITFEYDVYIENSIIISDDDKFTFFSTNQNDIYIANSIINFELTNFNKYFIENSSVDLSGTNLKNINLSNNFEIIIKQNIMSNIEEGYYDKYTSWISIEEII